MWKQTEVLFFGVTTLSGVSKESDIRVTLPKRLTLKDGNDSLRSLQLLKVSPADIQKVCVPACTPDSEPTMLISLTTPDEHPPPPPPCRWPAVTLPTLAKFQPVWRRL